MREIRFRAWDTKTETMFKVIAVSFKVTAIRYILIQGRVPNHNTSYSTPSDKLIGDRGILMQNTGLKDKNGVKIYEGDIVQTFNASYDTPDREDEVVITNDSVAKVVFELGQFRCDDSPLCIQTTEYPNQLLDLIEVIGNIWENPELLK